MILVIDNYDSFTYNLVQLIGRESKETRVVRNDKIRVGEITQLQPSGIVISPGPGRPEQAGVCVDVIRMFGPSIPILGVCLGHQAIGYAFGGTVTHAPNLMHGKTSEIHHDDRGIFAGLPNPFEATRYHSLVVDTKDLPADLLITATTNEGVIMGIRHREHPIVGIQFHPESVLTTAGPPLIANWIHTFVEAG